MRATLLAATVSGPEFTDGEAVVRVNELIGETPNVSEGTELTGQWNGRLPCTDGCADVDVGDSVLVFYRFPGFPDECQPTAGKDCVNGGQMKITKWGEQVVLARTTEAYSMAAADLPLLQSLDLYECQSRFGDSGRLSSASDDVGNVFTTTCEDEP